MRKLNTCPCEFTIDLKEYGIQLPRNLLDYMEDESRLKAVMMIIKKEEGVLK